MTNLITIDRLAEAIEKCGEANELFYLASPYSTYAEGMFQAAQHAAKIASLLLDRDLIVISPIVHGHHVDAWSLSGRPHYFWMRQCLALLPKCRGLIVAALPGWDTSSGVGMEVEWAVKNHMPTFYLDVDGLI